MRRTALALLVSIVFVLGFAAPAAAGQLPDNCTRDKGTVTCTTFDGPGNNQAGVGETTIDETQGNTTNKSAEESQDLDSIEYCNPPSSNGKPCYP